jgi:hypothetical protein
MMDPKDIEAGRYSGKLYLRAVECWVLWAIDALTPEDERFMETLKPILRNEWAKGDTWVELVSSSMEFPADLPPKLKQGWLENRERAQKAGHSLTAEEFAKAVCDKYIIK